MNIFALIPVIFEVVKLVEKLLPDSEGKEKFEAAVSVVEQVYGDISEHKDVVATAINGSVAALNAANVFVKKDADALVKTALDSSGPYVANGE